MSPSSKASGPTTTSASMRPTESYRVAHHGDIGCVDIVTGGRTVQLPGPRRWLQGSMSARTIEGGFRPWFPWRARDGPGPGLQGAAKSIAVITANDANLVLGDQLTFSLTNAGRLGLPRQLPDFADQRDHGCDLLERSLGSTQRQPDRHDQPIWPGHTVSKTLAMSGFASQFRNRRPRAPTRRPYPPRSSSLYAFRPNPGI